MTKALLAVTLGLALASPAQAAPRKKKPAATKPAPAATPAPAPAAAEPEPAAAPAPVDVAPSNAGGNAGATVGVEKGNKKVHTMDFTAMGIEGKVLTPQLLYLLGRIKVELEKTTLEGRSFVPELVRSVDEGGM